MTQAATPVKHFDAQAVTDWLLMLHGDSPGYLHISSTGNWEGRAFPADQIESASAYVAELDAAGRQGIYLRTTTLRTLPPLGGRGSAGDSFALPGLWADVDIAGPGHAEANLPPTQEHAIAAVAASGLPEPSAWIHSGGGLYPWWLLRKPHLIEADLADIAAMSEAWQLVIAHGHRQHGYRYGTGVHDLARVLRIAGTVNRKAGLERPCQLLPGGAGPLYSLDELRDALASAVSAIPDAAPAPRHTPTMPAVNGARPGDDFEARTDWADILEPHGWTLSHMAGRTRYWCRPGKDRRDGHSATTGHEPSRDRLYVFTTDSAFEANRPYNKFGAHVLLEHGGDFSAATRQLSASGFGAPRPTSAQPVPADPYVPTAGTATEASPPGPDDDEPELAPGPDGYALTDLGNGLRLMDRSRRTHRFVPVVADWMAYDGQVWAPDHGGVAIEREAGCMLKDLAGDGESEAMRKHALRSQSGGRVRAAVNQCRVQMPVVVSDQQLDADLDLVTCRNGVLNICDGVLHPHSPDFLLTRRVNANYDPAAQAPAWLAFLEQVMPDEQMRVYAQRLAGYTLCGRPNRRVMVALVGPSGTGKSKFVETLAFVFGTMAQTAGAGTFRRKRGADNAGLDPGLHSLRGARYVSTSETAEGSALDEELVKRVTGEDQIQSRTLHERPQEWTPRFTLWLATNFMPRISTEDGATWDRVKILNFDQQFTVDGAGGTQVADPDLLSRLKGEADGIFAWIVAGLTDFAASGLQEPASVTRAVAAARRESDTVAQFFEDSLAEGALVRTPGASVKSSLLYARYVAWCAAEGHQAKVQTLFGRRAAAAGFERGRGEAGRFYVGLGLTNAPGQWVVSGRE